MKGDPRRFYLCPIHTAIDNVIPPGPKILRIHYGNIGFAAPLTFRFSKPKSGALGETDFNLFLIVMFQISSTLRPFLISNLHYQLHDSHRRPEDSIAGCHRRKGMRYTKQREHVFNILMDKEIIPLPTRYLSEHAERCHPSLATVYNCLDTLVECDLYAAGSR